MLYSVLKGLNGIAVQAYKLKGQKYKLLWPEREEFVRMAARFGATIVPVAAIGCEDAVTMLADAEEIKRIPILGARVAQNALDTIPQARRHALKTRFRQIRHA